MIGSIIGRYKIEAVLGSGGMGDVYRAKDEQLGRQVALKFVPEDMARRPDRLQRFLREARSLASLNHPGIVTVYSVEEAEGRHFIAMELVQGRTLSEAVPTGGMALRDLLHVGVQVADALAAAHGQGVVHRDLKPGNVMLAEDNRVKVIDFGLAKLMPEADAEEVGTSQDVTAALTGEGRILGTPAYMSPEQVEGGELDHRCDIFSLGVMLYEMGTGKRPFGGDSAISVVSAIIKDTPAPLREHRPELPYELERIVRRCLNKDVRERFQTTLDVRNELKDLQTDLLTGYSGLHPALPRPRSFVLPIGLGVAAVIAVIAFGFFAPRWLHPGSGKTQTKPQELAAFDSERAYHFATPRPWSFDPEPESWPAFSPDGEQLAFTRPVNGFDKIFVQPVDRSTPSRQATFSMSAQGDEARKQVVFAVGSGAVEIAEDTDDIMPAWSPDGKTLAFVRAGQPSGRILPSDIYGGWYAHDDCDVWTLDLDDPDSTPRPFIRRAAHPTFNTNGLMAFEASISGAYRIWVCDSRGRGLKQITDDPDPVFHLEPTWSPDGRKIAFRRQKNKYTARIAIVDIETHRIADLTADYYLSEPAWSPSGSAIYFTANPSSGFNLWRVPVDAEGESTGDIEPVTVGAGRDLSPTLSSDGQTLAYSQIGWNADLWIFPMDPLTGQTKGPPRPLVQSSREDTRASWSADERWIVFTSDREGVMNLYVAPFETEQGTVGPAHRITSGSGGDYQAQWSPDGSQVFFFSKRDGNEDIWTVDLDEQKQALGEPRRLTAHRASDTNPFVSPDGKWIAFHSDRSETSEVWLMRPDGTGQTNLFQVRAGGHYIPWYDATSYYASGRRFSVEGGEPERILPFGGAHMQFSPNRSLLLENDHADIKVGPVSPETGFTNLTTLVSYSAPISIDYTVWSPSGRWVIFDRNESMGGDIYLLSGLQ